MFIFFISRIFLDFVGFCDFCILNIRLKFFKNLIKFFLFLNLREIGGMFIFFFKSFIFIL